MIHNNCQEKADNEMIYNDLIDFKNDLGSALMT